MGHLDNPSRFCPPVQERLEFFKTAADNREHGKFIIGIPSKTGLSHSNMILFFSELKS